MPPSTLDERAADLAGRLTITLQEDGPGGLAIAATALRIADLALALEAIEGDGERERLFLALPQNLAAETLEELSPETRDKLLESTNDEHLVGIIAKAADDDAIYFLEHLDEGRAVDLLARLDQATQRELSLQFELPEDTAGRIMTRDLAVLRPFMTAAQAIEALRAHKRHEGPLFVVDAGNRLVGTMRFRELVFAQSADLVSGLMERDPIHVRIDSDREEVAQLMQRYHLSAVPVVDEADHLHGMITWDDAVDVLEAEAEEDMLHIAGTVEDPEDNDGVLRRSMLRLPYLIVTVIGGFAMAKIIDGQTDELLSRHPILMGFLPMVPALAGSIGLQCSTVTVRMIATGSLAADRVFSRGVREVLTGVFLGLLLSILCMGGAAVITILGSGQLLLAGVIGLALFLAISLAGLMGVLIPVVCMRVNIDPAVAAGPFITMLNDVLGVSIYLITAGLLVGSAL